jgi:hypothetical protein
MAFRNQLRIKNDELRIQESIASMIAGEGPSQPPARLGFVSLGFIFFLFYSAVSADEASPFFIEELRPMGMGGAFIAVADDYTSMFYNPAGLARFDDFHLTLPVLSFDLGGRTLNRAIEILISPERRQSFSNTVANTQLALSGGGGSLTDEDKKNLKDVLNDIQQLEALVGPGISLFRISLNNFGVGLFVGSDLSTGVDKGLLKNPSINPLSKALVSARADVGVVASFAGELLERDALNIGTSLKYFWRADANVGASPFNALIGKINVPIKLGQGLGIDFGGLYHFYDFPGGQFTAGMAIRDFFGTSIFGQKADLGVGGGATDTSKLTDLSLPPNFQDIVPMSINLGVAYRPDLYMPFVFEDVVFAFDLDDIFNHYPGPPGNPNIWDGLLLKTHFGLESKVFSKTISFRAGLNQGYPAFGVGIDLVRFITLDYAFSGYERGEFPGLNPLRKHRFSISFGWK